MTTPARRPDVRDQGPSFWSAIVLIVCVVAFALLWAAKASAQQADREYRIALSAAIVANAVDLESSVRAFERGTGVEVNPILRPLSDKPLLFGLAKTGIAAASLLAIDWLRRRGHLRLAKVALWAQTILFSATAIHNTRLALR